MPQGDAPRTQPRLARSEQGPSLQQAFAAWQSSAHACAYFPKIGIVASALGNTQMNLFPLLKRLFVFFG